MCTAPAVVFVVVIAVVVCFLFVACLVLGVSFLSLEKGVSFASVIRSRKSSSVAVFSSFSLFLSLPYM
jgi:hypothetical protein